MDNIHYNFIDVEIPGFNPEFFDLWISNVVDHYKKTLGEISFVFCSDNYLLNINKEHLDHDFYTDVITFNYNEYSSLSGDIFISYERILENSEVFSNGDIHDELCRVMIHGVLHLIGFDDKSDLDEAEMRKQESFCLNIR